MKKEDLKVGMKVRCYRKTPQPENFKQIQEKYGINPIGEITKIYTYENIVNVCFAISGGNWEFSPEDIGPTVLDIPAKKEYFILKPITIFNIAKEKPCHNEFVKLLELFPLRMVESILPLDQITTNKVWTDWLITKGFIVEKKPEKFYHIGQRFCWQNQTYLLASTTDFRVNFISLEKGTRFAGDVGVRVGDCLNITQEEFNNLCSGRKFTEIKE